MSPRFLLLRPGSFWHYQKPSFHTVGGDPIPHHTRLALAKEMAKLDKLASVKGVKLVISAKAALAVVHEVGVDGVRKRVFKTQFYRPGR